MGPTPGHLSTDQGLGARVIGMIYLIYLIVVDTLHIYIIAQCVHLVKGKIKKNDIFLD